MTRKSNLRIIPQSKNLINKAILSNNKSSSLVMAQVKRLLKNNIEILYTNNVEEQIKALKAFDLNETLKVNLQNMHEAI